MYGLELMLHFKLHLPLFCAFKLLNYSNSRLVHLILLQRIDNSRLIYCQYLSFKMHGNYIVNIILSH